MKYFLGAFFVLSLIFSAQSQTQLSSGFLVKEIRAEGKISDKYEINMYLLEESESQFREWTNIASKPEIRGTVLISNVYGKYLYVSKQEEISLTGSFRHYDLENAKVDSLILNEFTKEAGFTGSFNLKITDSFISGFWISKNGDKKLKVSLTKNNKDFASAIEVFENDNRKTILNFEPESRSELLIKKKIGTIEYMLFNTSVPHCRVYQSFGPCCGGDDAYYKFVKILPNGNYNLVNSEMYADCASPDDFIISPTFDKDLKLFNQNKIAEMYLGTIKSKGRMIINSKMLDKGIQFIK